MQAASQAIRLSFMDMIIGMISTLTYIARVKMTNR